MTNACNISCVDYNCHIQEISIIALVEGLHSTQSVLDKVWSTYKEQLDTRTNTDVKLKVTGKNHFYSLKKTTVFLHEQLSHWIMKSFASFGNSNCIK